MTKTDEIYREIANYVTSIRTDESRKVRDSETNEELGFWQTSEWIEGLKDLVKKLQENDRGMFS